MVAIVAGRQFGPADVIARHIRELKLDPSRD
jgi:hypothetical protein